MKGISLVFLCALLIQKSKISDKQNTMQIQKDLPRALLSKRIASQDKLDAIKLKLKRSRADKQVKQTLKVCSEVHRHNFKFGGEDYSQIHAKFQKDCFQNQRDFGNMIVQKFKQNTQLVNCLAVAPTQSGKTGSMLSIIHHAMLEESLRCPIQNCFVITAHSDKAWVDQTRKRFPRAMYANVIHRNMLAKHVDTFCNLQNAWIIIDEAHIGCKMHQSLFNVFHKAGFFDMQRNLQRNIKFVPFSATPSSIQKDIESWGCHATCLHMQVPKQYVGVDSLVAQQRVLQCKDLYGVDESTKVVAKETYEHIREILDHIGENPKFHIIRTPRGLKHAIVMQNFKKTFSEFDFEFISEPKIKKFDSLFEQAPQKHTFVFIKDKLRCAKTLDKDHIGVLYDRVVTAPNHDSVLQGLLGRLTGFHANTNSVVFSNFHISKERPPTAANSFWNIAG